MEWFKTKVDDKSIKTGGKQKIETLEGYYSLFSTKEGLPYLQTVGGRSDSNLTIMVILIGCFTFKKTYFNDKPCSILMDSPSTGQTPTTLMSIIQVDHVRNASS